MSPVGVTAFRVIAAALLLLFIQRYSPGRYAFNKLRQARLLVISETRFRRIAPEPGVVHQRPEVHDRCAFCFGGDVRSFVHIALRLAARPGETHGTNLFGMALSICGIFFLNLDKNLNIQTAYLMGDLLTLGGSVAFAYYTVMSKHVAAKYGAVSATTFTYLAGACVFLPVGLPALVTLPWLQLPWGVLVAFFYVAVLASVLAPLIFYYALRSMSASRLAALTYLQPVVTTISSVLILSEKLTLNFLMGGSIVSDRHLTDAALGQSAGASRVARHGKRRDSGQILESAVRAATCRSAAGSRQSQLAIRHLL